MPMSCLFSQLCVLDFESESQVFRREIFLGNLICTKQKGLISSQANFQESGK